MRPGHSPNTGKKSPLAAGDSNVHTQQVTGNVGNCVIPSDAVAVSMNVTIVSPTAQSNLRVFPADVATPTASNLNWLPGQSPTPNKVDVQLSPGGKIKLYNHAGTVYVLADVVGYYTNSTLIELSTRIVRLEMAQPFTESNEIVQTIQLSSNAASPTNVISTTVNAPVAGKVSVHVSAYASGGNADSDRVHCTITTGTSVDAPRLIASPMPSQAFPGLAGVRTFDVAVGSSTKFKLLCIEVGGNHLVWERTMTAIFTPAS
jgi:hypothetical protein